MDIQEFIDGLDTAEKAQFAELAGTSTAYLYQLAKGIRKAGHDLAKTLVEASRQMFPTQADRWLTLSGVRPDIWGSDAAA